MTGLKNISKAEVLTLKDEVAYQKGQVVSKTLAQNAALSVTLFSFDKGEEISTHESGGDAFVTWLDGMGRITDTAYALYTPAGYRCLNVFVLRRDLLLELVAECASRNGYSLRRNILQEMGARLKLYGYVYDGYAAHINTLQSYYDRSMELLDTGVRGRLFCPERPVYGKENDSPSSYIDPEGGCVNSLVADGCDIQGSVKNCVLFRNVRIEKGASVENCILFKDTVVKRGAILRGVITDKYVTISENVTLMGHERYPIVIAKGATV